MIEKLLIEHCSPTLASLKSANLCSVHYESESELEMQISDMNKVLASKGISLILMKKRPGWALMYVCRKEKLQKRLQDKEVVAFLTDYGYQEMNVEAALERLKNRLIQAESFPHEVGIFLDYPVGDVRGFIQNAGRNYKCNGCWKVYCNECDAVKLFEKYKKCKQVYRKLWGLGVGIQRLAVAA